MTFMYVFIPLLFGSSERLNLYLWPQFDANYAMQTAVKREEEQIVNIWKEELLSNT